MAGFTSIPGIFARPPDPNSAQPLIGSTGLNQAVTIPSAQVNHDCSNASDAVKPLSVASVEVFWNRPIKRPNDREKP
jgi:hypothetical protein